MMSPLDIAAHLRHHASDYFADLGGPQASVMLRRTRRRINSTLYEFSIGEGQKEHGVLVKVPTPLTQDGSGASTGADHPRLFPKVNPELKSRFEFDAMRAIERYVGGLDDPRFGAVRILELLPGEQALAMEKVGERSLRDGVRRAYLAGPASDARQQIGCTVRNAGAWLRRHHGLPDLPHTLLRGASRSAFIESISRFTSHLGEGGERSYFQRLNRELREFAEALLPPLLPLGLGHGDFTPSNILAGPTGRIRIIDTLGRWNGPIYEDISRFLMAVKASVPRLRHLTTFQRAPVHQQLERQFLYGYFGDQSAPMGCIRLFECQAVVERAAAFAFRYRESRGWKRIVKGGRALWWNRLLRKTLSSVLSELRIAVNTNGAYARGGM